jgi:hypothetical protein
MARFGLVLLEGGPSDAPQIAEAASDNNEAPVKIIYGNGIEHYVFANEYADIGDGPMPVYRWAYRKPGVE